MASNPVQKVIELLTQLEGKVIKDGEAEQKAFEEYAEWCETGAKDKEWEIKTAKSEIEDLEATISKAGSDIDELTSKISDLASSISSNEADLKAATEIREKEYGDFAASEAELVDAVDTLDRAITVLERELKGSALMQVNVATGNMGHLIQVLQTVIDAASINSHDRKKLMALAQSDTNDEDDGMSMLATGMGAPDPEAYKSHSGSIVDVLEDMREKAEGQLNEERKAEMNSKHNYDMLKQSLEDELAVDKKDMAESKAGKSSATETKATAEGDLAVTQKDLADAQKVLGSMHSDCMTQATDHETSVQSRAEELKALAEAKKIIASMTGGAEAQSYSFLQVGSVQSGSFVHTSSNSNIQSRADLANFEVVTLLKRLAREQHSAALSQLASKIATSLRFGGSGGDDPFAKVKGLISDMIERLVKEGEEEASHKAYCDTEMGKTKKKRAELEHDQEVLTAKIDKAKATSAKLKEEVATLQKEIADTVASQAEIDKIYAEEKETFKVTKADLEQGLEGVRMALKVLKDYYAAGGAALLQGKQPADPGTHSKSSGAASGIIGMLEVVESDFSKNLAAAISEHETADVEYEKVSMQNRVSKAIAEQDVKYKTKEAASLDKAISEHSSDLEGVESELEAIYSYTKTLRGQCEIKPESYEDRAKRREAEISGLKEALAILEGESVFIQRTHKESSHRLRGVVSHKKI
jgi:chromosome segregation ATPase